MAENPPGEKLLCTTVLRSLIQITSSNVAGIATSQSLQRLETVIIMICRRRLVEIKVGDSVEKLRSADFSGRMLWRARGISQLKWES